MPKFNAAFWDWFGDSKVVNKDGQPLVVYHGTKGKFTVFSDEEAPDRGGLLAFFTTSKKFAQDYAGPHGHVMPVYLNVENPFDYRAGAWLAGHYYEETGGLQDMTEVNRILMGLGKKESIFDEGDPSDLTGEMFERAVAQGSWDAIEAPEFVEYLHEGGYDGVILHEHGATNYGVFSPTQIKSVHNRGTWDPEDPDIRRNPGSIRQSFWITPKGELIEVEPDEHVQYLVDNVDKFISKTDQREALKHETAGVLPSEWLLDKAIERGAIRLIFDRFDPGEPPSWAADLSTGGVRWRERLNAALKRLKVPRRTRVHVYDFFTEQILPAGHEVNPKHKIRYLYHSTSADALPSIAARGLVPSETPHWGGMLGDESLGRIYAASTPEKALFYSGIIFRERLRSDGFAPLPVILRFAPGQQRWYEESAGEYWSDQPVDPGQIRILWHGRWRTPGELDETVRDMAYEQSGDNVLDWEGTPVGSRPEDAVEDVRAFYQIGDKP